MKYIKKFNEGIFDIFKKRKDSDSNEDPYSDESVIRKSGALADHLKKLEDVATKSREYQDIKNMILNGSIKSMIEIKSGFRVKLNDDRTVDIKTFNANDYGDTWPGKEIYVYGYQMIISDSTFDKIRNEQKSIIIEESGSDKFPHEGSVWAHQGISGTFTRRQFLETEGRIFISESDFDEIYKYIKEWYDTRETDYLSKIPKRDFRLEERKRTK